MEKKLKITLKKEFDCEPVYNKKYLKTKINSYNGKINTNFYKNKILKERSQRICLWVILIDYAFRAGNNHYPQVFLEECKNVIEEKRFPSTLMP